MSEYQSYEFQALDRPLSSNDQSYIRSLSSRVELTSTQARFTYHYGDFRGQPQDLLDRCFDIMTYVASFGVRRLMIRLPKALVDPAILAPYLVTHYISATSTERSLILDIHLSQEAYYTWIEEQDYLDALIPLRDEILNGDRRLLYLAWLASGFSEDGPGDLESLIEPPVPANLHQLSPALQAFADLFMVDSDLIAAAAEASVRHQTKAEPIADWIAALPEADRIAYLVRLVQGETHVGVELKQRLKHTYGQAGAQPSTSPGRTLADLVALAEEQKQRRDRQAQAAAATAKKRRLTELAPKTRQIWAEVTRLIALKQSKAYDDAVTQLLVLRDIAEHQGNLATFHKEIQTLQQQYSGRPALLSRLRKVGLSL